MVDGGQNGFHQVFCAQAQAGSIDAGVAAHIFAVQHIFIDQKLHMVFGIVHQAQHTDRAGSDIKELFHIFRLGKGQARGVDLGGWIIMRLRKT